jgi:hypothetical protein
MFSEYFLFFNILLFSGFGLEIIFGHKRSRFRPYFNVCLVNSFTLVVNSLLFFALKDFFFDKHHIGGQYVFLIMPAAAMFFNEFLFKLVRHSDFNIFDSLNFVGAVFPMFIYAGARDMAEAFRLSSGAALGFLLFSLLFFHIKRHAGANCESGDDFTAFCYEIILFGLFSASFSIFFKVV